MAVQCRRRWFIGLLVCMFIFTSCTTGGGRGLSSHPTRGDAVHQKISDARALHEQGHVDAAISSLQTWVDTTPYVDEHDRAYELIVEWLLQLNRYDEAKRVASFFLARHPKSPSAARIIKLFDEQKPLAPQDDEYEPEMVDDQGGGENPMDSVLDKEKEAAHRPPVSRVDGDLKDYILFAAPIAEVMAMTRDNNSAASLAHARMAMHYFHLKDLEKSAFHVERAQNVPADIAPSMVALKQEIDAIRHVDVKSFGVLLPLSGAFAPFGKKTLAAMQLAWALPLDASQPITTLTKDGIRIVIADSKGDMRETEKVVEQLVKTHKVALIIGDITNEPSLIAAQRCHQYGVPMLSLSRHPSIADVGDNIFVLNASLKQQVERLVTHAIKDRGHKRFAILFPRHNYGMSMSRMFFDEVLKQGGTVTGIEGYDTHETTFFGPVKKLVGKYYMQLRPEASACSGPQAAKCRNSIKPIVDFDALFIPEFQKLALVIPALLQEDLLITNNPRAKASLASATKIENPPYIQLLGANSWNDKALLEKIVPHVDGAFFVDSFSFDQSESLKTFATNFTAHNGQAPSTLEVFAYDSALLALKLLNAPDAVASRKELRERIANFKGQIGLLPSVSFLKSGELDAPETGFQVNSGAVTLVPAT